MCQFRSIFISLLITLCKEFSKIPNKDAATLKIQAPVINTLVNTESTIKNGVLKEDHIKDDELARHFEYISTMSSFDDPVFINISDNLLKDRHATWRAFQSLSPKSV